jgi:hypothetical protein
MRRAPILEEVLDRAPFGFVLLDADLRYVWVNEAAAAINGVPPEQHPGRHGEDVVPGVAATLDPLLRQVLATGEPVPSVRIEGETGALPGVRRQWSVRMFPIDDGVGMVIAELAPPDRGAAIVLREVVQGGTLAEVPGLELVMRRLAADPQVPGGDFCDVFPVAPGRWAAMLGDAHRSGVITAAAIAAAREAARTALVLDPDPAAGIRAVGAALDARDDVHEPLTCAIAVLEPAAGSARVRAAATPGHPLPVACATDGRTRIQRASARTLAPGETLLMHSAGLTAGSASSPALGAQDVAWMLADTRLLALGAAADQFERAARRRPPDGDDATVLLIRPRR